MLETNNTKLDKDVYDQYSTEKYSCKRILFLIDSNFVGNSSGIYTFMKHIIRMFNTMGYVVDIISDRVIYNDIDHITLKKRITLNFPTNGAEGYYDSTHIFEREICKYISRNSPELIIANSLFSTKAIISLGLEERSVSYTHIGDLMDESKKNMHDFDEESVSEYLNVLNNSSIQIGTQSNGSKNRMLEVLPKRTERSVSVLFEPYIVENEIIDFYDEKKGVIIISGNYKRKAYDKMLSLVGKCGLPVTIVCGNVENGYFDIRELIYKNKINEFRILNNYNNEMMPQLIKGHRMMIQLADIEVFPYSIVESIFHIPCVINGKSKWGQEFLEEAIKIDPEDYSVDSMIDIYNNFESYDRLDYNKYYNDTKYSWSNYIKRLIKH